MVCWQIFFTSQNLRFVPNCFMKPFFTQDELYYTNTQMKFHEIRQSKERKISLSHSNKIGVSFEWLISFSVRKVDLEISSERHLSISRFFFKRSISILLNSYRSVVLKFESFERWKRVLINEIKHCSHIDQRWIHVKMLHFGSMPISLNCQMFSRWFQPLTFSSRRPKHRRNQRKIAGTDWLIQWFITSFISILVSSVTIFQHLITMAFGLVKVAKDFSKLVSSNEILLIIEFLVENGSKERHLCLCLE